MRIVFAHNLKRTDAEEEAEFDTQSTVDAIADCLRLLRHEVFPVDVSGPASSLVMRLETIGPDLIFNTAEGSRGRAREAFFPALYEQLGIPYTGSDAYVCCVTLDKHLTKTVVQEAGVAVPKGWLVRDMGNFVIPDELRFPVFIKPNFEGSSKGIDENSKVADAGTLITRLGAMLKRYPDGILVEEFIPGRDIAVGFLETGSPETEGVLPPIAYSYGTANDDGQAIYDYRLKNENSDAVHVEVDDELDDDLRARIIDLSQRAYRALGVRDIGRIDFRLTPDGRVYFLEVNALPSLEPGAGIYVAAAAQGIAKPERVLEAVLRSAIDRHGLSEVRTKKRRKVRVGLTYNLKRRDDESDAEFDSQDTVDALAAAIADHGHDVVPLEATSELPTTLRESGVEVVFNIAEGIRGRSREAQVPALLELVGIPHTGSDASTMAVTLDKAMAKRLVRDAGHLTPRFTVMRSPKARLPPEMTFPLVVKPLSEGSSKGVSGNPVVEDLPALRERVAALLERFGQPALVEQFLPGRELTIAMLGERRPRILAPMEVVFHEQAGDRPTYSYEAKQTEQALVSFQCPAVLDASLQEAVRKLARGVWDALGCCDVARIDLRLDAEGQPSFIECNPLPGLSPGFSDLCVIAEKSGLTYSELIGEILAPALRRMRAARSER